MPKALLLIDLQNDFLADGAMTVPDGNLVIPIANQVQSHFDLIVATQDWHPADHVSFAANHPGKRPGDVIELGGREQVLWPVHCVQDTRGAEFPPELDRSRWAHLVQHGTDRSVDSHSGFFDEGRRHDTGLAEFLRSNEVDDLYVLGLPTDHGVKWTALDAVSLDFRVWLIADGCRGVNLQPTAVDTAIDEMRGNSVQFITSASMASLR